MKKVKKLKRVKSVEKVEKVEIVEKLEKVKKVDVCSEGSQEPNDGIPAKLVAVVCEIEHEVGIAEQVASFPGG